MQRRTLLFIAGMIAGLGFLLPAVVTVGAALMANTYDLAEWMSLHPAVRAETPTLLTAFLLRASAVGVSLLLIAGSRKRWHAVVIVLLCAAAMLPPFEIVRYPDDPNYRQQALISLSILALGTPLIVWRQATFPVIAIVSVVCMGGVVFAGLRAVGIFRGFGLTVELGLGWAVMLVGFTLAIITTVSALRRAPTKKTGRLTL